MDTLSYKTQVAKPSTVVHKWYIVDAENQTLGRISSEIAKILQGKNKPSYTTHFDAGDHVIIINAEKVHLSGKKLTDKVYVRHTGYPGGQRFMTPKIALAKKPEFVLENAISHMLPRTRLGRAMFKKLHVFAGTDHPHAAQKPEVLKFNNI
ncbi:MAG: 50S ribosomal protein L13 [Chitinophagales bacterium]|nr:50S ribosomal protein L13 [Saprospirales bacterium]MBK8351223.1 50S ribosomal protein L13 [Saprospirales bacterium]MBP6661248.1 50S ribosomal protein L13 [Chitinophagales bacterium]